MNVKRVAQLLASEIEGHEGRGLGELRVVDADRDAEPSPEGTRAYRITDGETELAVVDLYPDFAAVLADEETRERARENGLDVEGGVVRLPDGASVKRVLPALAR
jgi:hypothetical protein